MTPTTTQQIHVGGALACPGRDPISGPVDIHIAAGRILAVTPTGASQSPLLALPPLVNGHDHGRGLTPLAYGALDQTLELWLPALKLQPSLSVYTVTALALAQMARSGIGAAVHCHNPSGGDLMEAVQAVCQAARDVGLRLALAVPMNDRNALAYGDPQRLLELVPAADRPRLQQLWSPPTLPAAEQVARVEAIAAACEDDYIHVQYCPWGPQWCSPTLLEGIAAAAADTGRPVHMHLLETRYQRQWADAHYPQGLVRYLDDIGLLSPRLTVAHGVWLRPDEMELLAQRGVVVSVNTSSNLRLRSGIPPYQRLRAAGVAIAFGLDGMALHNPGDAFQELRLNYHLHAQDTLAPPTPADLFEAQRQGLWAVTHRRDLGQLQPGQGADILLLNDAAMGPEWLPQTSDPLERIVACARPERVAGLWVNGRQVVNKGQVLGVNEAELAAEVAAGVRSQAAGVYSLQPLARRYQEALKQFYGQGLHQQPDPPQNA